MTTTRQKLSKFIKRIKTHNPITKTLRAKREAAFAFSNPGAPPVLIYQMGKVGSSTVYRSLLAASLPNSIFHLHCLSDDLITQRSNLKKAGVYPPPYHIYLGEATQKQLNEHPDFPIKIISLVRDPIALKIFDIFQNPSFTEESIQTDTGLIDSQKASKYINNTLSNSQGFPYIYEWFNKELKTVFDIDVFAQPFPLEAGYAVYSKANVEVLLIRLEDLSEKGPKAISDFLKLENPLDLKRNNSRDNSKDKDAYHEVHKSISLSLSTCKQIYSSDFVKHFYNESMINTFLSKWVKSSIN